MAIRFIDAPKSNIRFVDAPSTPEMSAPQAALEAATRGGSIGMSDVLIPAIGAGVAKLFGGDATKGMSYEDLFAQAQGDVSGRRQQFQEQSPVMATGLEIAGSLPTGGALVKGAQAAGLGAKAALAGTAAVEGFGLAEGDIQQKAEQSALSAVMAPAVAKVFEKAAPATIRAVRKFSESVTDPVKTILGSTFNANPIAAREFMREGVPVSALSISDNPTIGRMGSILKGTFGSTNVIERNTNQTLEALTKRINEKAFSTGREITSQEAGATIQKGVENYIDRFQQVSSRLYGRVGKFIGDSDVSDLSNIKRLVTGEMQNLAQTPNLQSKIAKNKAIVEAANAIEDAGKAGLPYSALRRYRTEVGSLIKQNVISGEDNALAKRVYAALTDDMQDLARSKGTQALRAFNNANAFYKNGLETIEKKLGKYVGTQADPGQLLNSVRASTKNSDFKLKAIMKAVPQEDRPIIRDAILQKIGVNSQGDFSTALFFRDYNKISKEAKSILFGNTDAGFRQSLDRLASISKRLTESGRFANTSRTADNLGNIGLIAIGAIEPTTAISAGVGANMGARLLTNRSFAKVLAKHAQKPITQSAMTRFMGDLEKLAINNPALENDISAYIGLVGANSAALIGE